MMARPPKGTTDSSEHAMRSRARRGQARTNEILKHQAAENQGRDFHELKFVNPSAFNSRAEEKFVELVRTLIEENGGRGYPVWEVCREAAYEIKISMDTAKRYLMKHSARRAEFLVFGKQVMLNPRYEPPAEPEAEGGDEDPDR
jgi:hypothetical protein